MTAPAGPCSVDEDSDKRRHWKCDVNKLRNLPRAVKQAVMLASCKKNFEDKILELANLSPSSSVYANLKEMLCNHLTFRKEHHLAMLPPTTMKQSPNSSHRRLPPLPTPTVDYSKFPAIIAGSYPAYIAGAVRKYSDVDLFVIVTEASVPYLAELWHCLHDGDVINEGGAQLAQALYWETMYKDILWVKNFGSVQIILRFYSFGCMCDRHLNTVFFKDFHHCTRWKLDVFADGTFAPRYMHLEGGPQQNVICQESAITPLFDKKLHLNRLGQWSSETVPRTYPNKHLANVVDSGPPKLSQQAGHVLLREPIVDEEDADVDVEGDGNDDDDERPTMIDIGKKRKHDGDAIDDRYYLSSIAMYRNLWGLIAKKKRFFELLNGRRVMENMTLMMMMMMDDDNDEKTHRPNSR